jgi:hypothetical protein
MIMKKNFLTYLLMMAFSITFFSACGDDKDDVKPTPPTPAPEATTWKDGVGAYKKDDASTVLKLNGADPAATKLVTLAAGTGDNAKITLTNIVPDDAAVEFDNVEMTKSENNYTFSSEKTVGSTTISISGTLSGIPATKADAKTLDINVTRKVASPVAGVWKLNFTETGGDVFFDVSTGDKATDAAFTYLFAPALGGMLAQKVTAVTATFSEDGIFDVNWIKTGETDPTGMPPSVKPLVGDIMYYASETQVFIALSKELVPMLAVLAGDVDMDALIASMVDKGDYYALPLNITIDGDTISFYSEKEMLIAFLPVIAPMLAGLGEQMPPEAALQMGPLLENLPAIIASSEKFNVGLKFAK